MTTEILTYDANTVFRHLLYATITTFTLLISVTRFAIYDYLTRSKKSATDATVWRSSGGFQLMKFDNRTITNFITS